MSTFTQAIYISAVGMGLVFVALGLLLLVMLVLQRAFPCRPAREVGQASTIETPVVLPEGLDPDVVAAVSFALARALAEERGFTGAEALGESRQGGWVVAGRSRQLYAPRAREKRS